MKRLWVLLLLVGLCGVAQGQTYDLESRFSVDDAAPIDSIYITTSGDTLIMYQRNSQSVSSGRLNISAANDGGFLGTKSWTREAGRAMLWRMQGSDYGDGGPSGNEDLVIGWSNDGAIPKGFGVGHGNAIETNNVSQLLMSISNDDVNSDLVLDTLSVDSVYSLCHIVGGFTGETGAPWYSGQTTTSYPYGQNVFMKEGTSGKWLLLAKSGKTTSSKAWLMMHNWSADLWQDDLVVPNDLLTDFLQPTHYLSGTGANNTSLSALTPEVGSAWTILQGTIQVQSNYLECISPVASSPMNTIAYADVGESDVYVEAVLNLGSGETADILIRFNSSDSSHYLAQVTNAIDLIRIYSYSGGASGTYTLRASASFSPPNNTDFILRVRCVGSWLRAWAYNSLIPIVVSYGSTGNTSATLHGIRMSNVGNDIAKWRAYPVGTGDEYSALQNYLDGTLSTGSKRRRILIN